MKRKNLKVLLFALFAVMFVSCASTSEDDDDPLGLFTISEYYWHSKNPPSFSPNWNVKNDAGEYCYYSYTIRFAPDKYADFIGTDVFYSLDGYNVGNMWYKDCRQSIQKALDYEEFHLFQMGDRSYICTEINFNDSTYKHVKKPSFEDEKKAIYSILSLNYAGFSDMKKKGFSKEIWNEASSYDDITAIFDKYINDTHLSINTNSGYNYHQSQRFDEGCERSQDEYRTFNVMRTSNTYYIRYNSCDISWDSYLKFPSLAKDAKNKDNIVLDFRSNNGGGNVQQIDFFRTLVDSGYKGTIYILQDNWSYSSGEVWEVTGMFSKKLNFKLVGTHSGGMQRYGNCRSIEKKGVRIWTPTTSFAHMLPDNYLGEGLGYEPDIWATTTDMKEVLEGLGLDLTGVIFR